MSDRTIVLWTIAACMLPTPLAAQAPVPKMTAFDGTYAGVSRTFEGAMGNGRTRGCLQYSQNPSHTLDPLTIAGGAARYQAGVGTYVSGGGTYEGSVNAQGVLILRGPSGNQIDARIDGRGTVTGRLTGECSYQMVWQKEGK